MTILAAVLLALTAGIAEIIPVSGSGHLYLLAEIMGVPVSGPEFRSFRAMLLLGVGFAGVLFYHTQLRDMFRENLVLLGLLRPANRERGIPFGRRLGLLIALAVIPMGAAFLLNGLRQRIELGDYTLVYVSILLWLSGVLLFLSARSAREKRTIHQMTLHDAILTGVFQPLSVLPGFSRVGVTSSILMQLGLKGPAVAEFVGLLGVPVYLAAGFIQLFSAEGLADTPYLVLGFALSALTGFFTLRFFTDFMADRRPTVFAYWCWGAGILSMILFLISA